MAAAIGKGGRGGEAAIGEVSASRFAERPPAGGRADFLQLQPPHDPDLGAGETREGRFALRRPFARARRRLRLRRPRHDLRAGRAPVAVQPDADAIRLADDGAARGVAEDGRDGARASALPRQPLSGLRPPHPSTACDPSAVLTGGARRKWNAKGTYSDLPPGASRRTGARPVAMVKNPLRSDCCIGAEEAATAQLEQSAGPAYSVSLPRRENRRIAIRNAREGLAPWPVRKRRNPRAPRLTSRTGRSRRSCTISATRAFPRASTAVC